MAGATTQHYLIALGSNMRHRRIGAPRRVIAAAIAAMADNGIALLAVSPLMRSRPVGPSQRDYVNGAALIETPLAPPALLAALKGMERAFGRRRRTRRWSARVIDLDIILWSGGIWTSERPRLTIPHPAFRQRDFVLHPARSIAGDWRDPVTGLSIAQIAARHDRRTRTRGR